MTTVSGPSQTLIHLLNQIDQFKIKCYTLLYRFLSFYQTVHNVHDGPSPLLYIALAPPLYRPYSPVSEMGGQDWGPVQTYPLEDPLPLVLTSDGY